MKNVNFNVFGSNDLTGARYGIEFNRPGRKSNPIPERTEEEEEKPAHPGKDDPSKKKKKPSQYEVTC